MAFLDPLIDTIKQADNKELYTYLGIFTGIFLVLFGLMGYLHYSRVSSYTDELARLRKERTETRKLLQDYKIVKAQQQQVEEILAKDPDFRIGQTYQSILAQAGLQPTDKPIPRTGGTVSDKTEVQITSTIKGISMQQVTNFLLMIAKVPQLYTKDLTIKKVPGRSSVDIDITVATLESSVT